METESSPSQLSTVTQATQALQPLAQIQRLLMLDDLWTARSRDWHAIEVAADDLAVAAALVLEAAGEQRDLSENVG